MRGPDASHFPTVEQYALATRQRRSVVNRPIPGELRLGPRGIEFVALPARAFGRRGRISPTRIDMSDAQHLSSDLREASTPGRRRAASCPSGPRYGRGRSTPRDSASGRRSPGPDCGGSSPPPTPSSSSARRYRISATRGSCDGSLKAPPGSGSRERRRRRRTKPACCPASCSPEPRRAAPASANRPAPRPPPSARSCP